MKKVIVLGSALFLSACGQLTPFVDAHREAGQIQLVGQSTPDKVAVCYNPMWSDQNQVKELAHQECAKTNRKAVYSDTKWFSCCLANPSTAFYDCKNS
ncbi:MAG: hypothetical protein ACI4OR_03620 [Alphaproteobacteria bacterium]